MYNNLQKVHFFEVLQMKNIIFINGTMGVGKTTTCRQLNKIMNKSVWLDGDWCWMADPFTVTDETKAMVTDNICHLLNNFISCSEYENIIFCWVMDYESIYDSIVTNLHTENCNIWRFTLTCSEEELKKRVENDNHQDGRNFERSLERVSRFDAMNTVKIFCDNMSPLQTAEKIKLLINT